MQDNQKDKEAKEDPKDSGTYLSTRDKIKMVLAFSILPVVLFFIFLYDSDSYKNAQITEVNDAFSIHCIEGHKYLVHSLGAGTGLTQMWEEGPDGTPRLARCTPRAEKADQ